MEQNRGYVVGVGAANVDVHGRSKKGLILRDSNPGHMNTSVGGVTRNILENAALLGADARLVAAVGDDLYGEMIRRHCRQVGIGIDDLLTVADQSSSCYISILDENGDMFVALSDMSITNYLIPALLDQKSALLRGAAAIVTDGCLPPAVMCHLVSDAAGRVPVFVDPVSTAYATAIKDSIGKFHTVKPNIMELAVLAGMEVTDDASIAAASRILIEKGVRRVFTSLGPEGCFYMDSRGETRRRRLRPVPHMINATGAGDAFMGAIVYSYLMNFDIDHTLDCALAAGIVALEGVETINPEMSYTTLLKVIQERHA